jgi:hypothetical protein
MDVGIINDTPIGHCNAYTKCVCVRPTNKEAIDGKAVAIALVAQV